MAAVIRQGGVSISDMLEKPRVIVSHAAKQGNVYHRPWAAESAGIDVRFLTGLYYKPERVPYSLVQFLPEPRQTRVLKQLQKRQIPGLSSTNVVSLLGPALEIGLRPLGLINLWYNVHDWLASRWISHCEDYGGGATIVHGFQGCCVRTLRAARQKGMIGLYETTLPPIMTRHNQPNGE